MEKFDFCDAGNVFMLRLIMTRSGVNHTKSLVLFYTCCLKLRSYGYLIFEGLCTQKDSDDVTLFALSTPYFISQI